MRQTGVQKFPLVLNSLVLALCSWLVFFQGNTMVFFSYFNIIFVFSYLDLEELVLMPLFN